MRRLLVPLLLIVLVNGVYGICSIGDDIFDWTDVDPVPISNNWWIETDEDGNPLYPGTNVTAIYLAIDEDYLYTKFEVNSKESVNEKVTYTTRIEPKKNDVEYLRFAVQCHDFLEVTRKLNIGAAIDVMGGSEWDNIKDEFGVSAHLGYVEMRIPLEFLYNTDTIGLRLNIYYDSNKRNEVSLSEWDFDLCSTSATVCGDGTCEGLENNTEHPCVCPVDCPDVGILCFNTECGNDECELGEETQGSGCECRDDCIEKIIVKGEACPLGEHVTDWSGATVLESDNVDDHGEEWEALYNGTDLVALKAETDTENLYLMLELDPKETPHHNVTYNMIFRPHVGGVDSITLKINCNGLYELREKNDRFLTPTNYTASSEWESIRNNFTVSMTGHAVEVRIPWYVLYKANGMNIDIESYMGTDRVNDMYLNIDDVSSLFDNICNDGICTEVENDSSNRYQYCEQDCPDAEVPLWTNGVCGEGEADRWGPMQSIMDCWDSFNYLDVGKGPEQGVDQPTDNGNGGGVEEIFGPLLGITAIVAILTVGYRGVKRVYFKATAGRRKVGDLKKRKTTIDKEKKDLQQKFLETRISEEQFHKQMTELDREEQNIDLELKK
jgi:hypothetical protein